MLVRSSKGVPVCSLNVRWGSRFGERFGSSGGFDCLAVGALPGRCVKYADVFAAGGSSPSGLLGMKPFLRGVGPAVVVRSGLEGDVLFRDDLGGTPALNSSNPGLEDFGGGGCLKLLLSSLPD